MKQLAALTLALFATVALGQRVAPGVNPGHYQQQPYQQPQQHYQQQPPVAQQQHYQQQQQQQQPQYQQQQVPVQAQYQQPHQVPVQHQQVPVQGHPQQGQPHPQQQHHGQPQQVLNTHNIQHEKQHIAEHMDVPIDTSKMSEQELQFHYFKMHDSDNNNKLDGCELIKSLIHWHDDRGHAEKSPKPKHIYSDDELETIVGMVLNQMDVNGDGFVDYGEYRRSEVDQNRRADYPEGQP
ncbi:putative cyclin-dependent serine/threonine-protein kinase DDB_G0272797/DDB_G0274007 isoform X4 [Culex quinquefasciatus]|uniref:putative cyclin-dependent serine/threonine-protein kinase DDB_G0272797/DDB_G0274007 isoform X4 n=1 Tax=Culex quinquefasciatus TaxID=7176 RepID=UPI0018E2D229|nr:putative cyclin-dependent serine/threonine-protein kinase DDB_G0272797/DDB_G0274007 isoform X4 [Culex quinquefasciatus]